MGQESNRVRRLLARPLLFVGLPLLIAACAQAPRQAFDLASAAGPLKISQKAGPGLAVQEPTAAAPTSSDRIVVRDVDGSVSVLPDVQWSESLPRLLQERMIEALQKTGVSASRIGLGADRALATDVRRFEINVARNVAVVELSVRIVETSSGAARASQGFVAEAPAPEHTGAPAALALKEATAQALSRVAVWARGRL